MVSISVEVEEKDVWWSKSRERLHRTDAPLRNVFVPTHSTQHTRLLLDCGYSGLYPANPPQANTVHSDMEIFYWACLWCMNAQNPPNGELPKESKSKLQKRWTKTFECTNALILSQAGADECWWVFPSTLTGLHVVRFLGIEVRQFLCSYLSPPLEVSVQICLVQHWKKIW